jgi:hypothetical protein
MRSISCCKQDRRPENVLTDGFATLGPGKDPVRDAIFSVGARNESRVLSLMSALPVNAGAPGVPDAYAFSTSTAAATPRATAQPFGRMDRAESRRRAHRQQDRITEGTSPGGSGLQLCDQLSVFSDVLNVQFAFFPPHRLLRSPSR